MVYYYREGKGPRGAFSSIWRSFRETLCDWPSPDVRSMVPFFVREWACPTLSYCYAGGDRSMSRGKQRILEVCTRLAEDVGARQGAEVVDVEYVKERGEYYLRIFIDKPGGVGLDDCQAFSEEIGELLDEVDPIPGSYSLEISSPGIERPLKKERDFIRFAGRLAAIKTYAPLDGRKNWKGTLQGLQDDHVLIEVDGRQVTIPIASIAKAHLVAEF